MTYDVPLPEFALDYLHTASGSTAVIKQFHLWLDEQNLSLRNVDKHRLAAFLQHLRKKDYAPFTETNYRAQLKRYLTHLFLRGLVPNCNPPSLLPPYAITYLQDPHQASSAHLIKQFHSWLERRKFETLQLSVEQIQEFLRLPSGRILSRLTVNCRRRQFLPYLDYLYQHDLLPFPCDRINPHPKHLPPKAKEFLAEIAINLRAGTVNGYRCALRGFLAFLEPFTASVYDLERDDVVRWLRLLKEKELHPATRIHIIHDVRTFLRWLYEHDSLKLEPDYLIRREDFPKLPQYLPRPLSPDCDRSLQEHLLKCKNAGVYRRGLWLMRKTGLRIGELVSLEYDCIRNDQNDNAFLKVPLGKLNNERLVPLSLQAVEVIHQMQHNMPYPRKYLVSTRRKLKGKTTDLYRILRSFSNQQKLTKPIQSHQLRHTCATELINSGMSLLSVMHFLGHKDFRMTLRYAKITQETVLKEFQQALLLSEKKYEQSLPSSHDEPSTDGTILVSLLIKWCHQQSANSSTHRTSELIKQLYRLRTKVQKIRKACK
jgi:site-specific recombinase XerD